MPFTRPEYPPLDISDLTLLRRQRRIEKAFQRAALVGPMELGSEGGGGLLVAALAIY
jgi:hypothetical protein